MKMQIKNIMRNHYIPIWQVKKKFKSGAVEAKRVIDKSLLSKATGKLETMTKQPISAV